MCLFHSISLYDGADAHQIVDTIRISPLTLKRLGGYLRVNNQTEHDHSCWEMFSLLICAQGIVKKTQSSHTITDFKIVLIVVLWLEIKRDDANVGESGAIWAGEGVGSLSLLELRIKRVQIKPRAPGRRGGVTVCKGLMAGERNVTKPGQNK